MLGLLWNMEKLEGSNWLSVPITWAIVSQEGTWGVKEQNSEVFACVGNKISAMNIFLKLKQTLAAISILCTNSKQLWLTLSPIQTLDEATKRTSSTSNNQNMEGNYAKAYETLMQDERRLLQFDSFGKGWSLWTTKLVVTFISKCRFQTQRIALFKNRKC